MVHKLGHYGLVVPGPQFLPMRDWYTGTFNLAISDSVFSPSTGEDETSFIHVDRGVEFSDHHVSVFRVHQEISDYFGNESADMMSGIELLPRSWTSESAEGTYPS